MKKFLTKNEACNVLKGLNRDDMITHEQSAALTSIRVCIAAEEMGFQLWGKSVEDARPLFRSCETPSEESSEAVVENHKAYKLCFAEAYQKFATKKEE